MSFVHILVLVMLASLQLAGPAGAISTVDCHCFRERSFAPENPTAFDPYLLATVQNRLMAHVFSVPRKEIVSEKMSGASGDGLWVAYWLARAAGASPQSLKAEFSKEGSWRNVVTRMAIDPEALGSSFVAALVSDNQQELAWSVVTQVLADHFMIPDKQLADLHRVGASLQEAILASLLALINESSALDLFGTARDNGNWGSVSVASGAGIETIEAFLAQAFSPPVK